MLARVALPGLHALNTNLHWAPLGVLAILEDPKEQQWVALLIGAIIILVKLVGNMIDKFFGKEKNASQSTRCGFDHDKLKDLLEAHDHRSNDASHAADLARQAIELHHEQEIKILEGIHDAITDQSKQLNQLVMVMMSKSKGGQ